MGPKKWKKAEPMMCTYCKGHGSILVVGIAKMPCPICGGKGQVFLKK